MPDAEAEAEPIWVTHEFYYGLGEWAIWRVSLDGTRYEVQDIYSGYEWQASTREHFERDKATRWKKPGEVD